MTILIILLIVAFIFMGGEDRGCAGCLLFIVAVGLLIFGIAIDIDITNELRNPQPQVEQMQE